MKKADYIAFAVMLLLIAAIVLCGKINLSI